MSRKHEMRKDKSLGANTKYRLSFLECREFLKVLEAMYVITLMLNFAYKTPTCSLNYQVFDFL